MKVSTDSCILGAWFADKISKCDRILDIGSGTGLLMMMLAQKTEAHIHGIELDPACFRQLQENIMESKWNERLSAFAGDARSFMFREKYDFIISNPPFFENDLPSPVSEGNLARHSSELSLAELMQLIDGNLSSSGAFGVLLPYSRWEYFHTLAEKEHFHLCEKLLVRHSPAHTFSRAILNYRREKQDHSSTFEMSIRNKGGDYTHEFIHLLKDYYLYL